MHFKLSHELFMNLLFPNESNDIEYILSFYQSLMISKTVTLLVVLMTVRFVLNFTCPLS